MLIYSYLVAVYLFVLVKGWLKLVLLFCLMDLLSMFV